MNEHEQYSARDRQFLQEFIDHWDEKFTANEEINGGDLVDWVANWLERIRRADDVKCAYCGVLVPDDFIPNVEDEKGWEALAEEHSPRCLWIKTRAHQRAYPI